jgi:hypothetical protein
MLTMLILLGMLVVFGLAAVRWGYDSSEGSIIQK